MPLPPPEDLVCAPVSRRAAALVIDWLVLALLTLTLAAFAYEAGVALGTVFPMMIVVLGAYQIGFPATTGATPGKTALGLSIVGRDGSRLRPDSAVLRFLVYFICGAVFPFGTIANVVLLLSDGEHRTLADQIASTVVVEDVRPDG